MPRPPQGYALGWLFVVLEATTIAYRRDWKFIGGLVAAISCVLIIAAISRRPWGWHLLIALLPLKMAVGLGRLLLLGGGPPESRGWVVALLPAGIVLNAAWWIYFYRRRAVFGATSRWRWLERQYPGITGPEVSARPVVSLRWLYKKRHLRQKRHLRRSWRHMSQLSTYIIALSCPPAPFVRRGKWAAVIVVTPVWVLGAWLVGVAIVYLRQVALARIPITGGIVVLLYLGLFIWLLGTVLALVLWPAETTPAVRSAPTGQRRET